MPEGISDENFLNSFITDEEVQEEQENKGKETDEEEIEDPEEEEIEKEEEEEKEEEDDEDLEKSTSNIKPLMASIKEKYPNVFKEFPELKDSFFRARAYSTVFATPEEAKEAFADNEAYLSLRESALSGDPSALINTLKEADIESFTTFSRKFLPTLFKVDQDLYAETTLPILQQTLRYVFDEGKRNNNEEVQNAAKTLARVLGIEGAEDGSKNFVKPIKEPTEDKEENSRLFNESVGEVTTGITKSLNTEIRRGLDPDGALSAFMRKTIINETLNGIADALQHDKSFMSAQAARWKRAQREGFDDNSKSKIINAYLARAKSLMPNVRRKVLEQAVGDNKRGTDSKVRDIKSKIPARKELTNGRDSKGSGNQKPDASRIDWNKTSDMDLLNGNIKYKE